MEPAAPYRHRLPVAVGTPAPGTVAAAYRAMAADMLRLRLGAADPSDKATMIAAYERHNAAAREAAPADRLLEWRAADGWAPLAAGLGVLVPDVPFPASTPASNSARRSSGSWPNGPGPDDLLGYQGEVIVCRSRHQSD